MHPRLAVGGDRLVTPTYTGLGERVHLASASVGLDTHVEDVLGVLEHEDLRDVVLIGHSYGGMVATSVADRARDRIAGLVYLDAFAPLEGQSLFDLLPAEVRARMREDARANGDGWRINPNPSPADTAPEDLAWIMERRHPTPIRCFDTALTLRHGPLTLPRSYIYCTRIAPGDVFGQFAQRARRERWDYHEIDTSHSPNVTAPDTLAKVLRAIAEG